MWVYRPFFCHKFEMVSCHSDIFYGIRRAMWIGRPICKWPKYNYLFLVKTSSVEAMKMTRKTEVTFPSLGQYEETFHSKEDSPPIWWYCLGLHANSGSSFCVMNWHLRATYGTSCKSKLVLICAQYFIRFKKKPSYLNYGSSWWKSGENQCYLGGKLRGGNLVKWKVRCYWQLRCWDTGIRFRVSERRLDGFTKSIERLIFVYSHMGNYSGCHRNTVYLIIYVKQTFLGTIFSIPANETGWQVIRQN